MDAIEKAKATRRARLNEWFADKPIPAKEKSYLSQIMSGKTTIGERAARRLEKTYRMEPGFLDRALDASEPVKYLAMQELAPYNSDYRAVPVISFIQAGEFAESHSQFEPGVVAQPSRHSNPAPTNKSLDFIATPYKAPQ